MKEISSIDSYFATYSIDDQYEATGSQNVPPEARLVPEEPPLPSHIEAEGFTLKNYIVRLQSEASIPTAEVEIIFAEIVSALPNEESVQALVSLMPESMDGLHPIAGGLLSSSPRVRMSTVHILRKVQMYTSTNPAIKAMNGLLLTAFARQVGRLDDGSLQCELDKYEVKVPTQASSGPEALRQHSTEVNRPKRGSAEEVQNNARELLRGVDADINSFSAVPTGSNASSGAPSPSNVEGESPARRRSRFGLKTIRNPFSQKDKKGKVWHLFHVM
jgi:hypothetical protein